jgi:hypothetical protein
MIKLRLHVFNYSRIKTGQLITDENQRKGPKIKLIQYTVMSPVLLHFEPTQLVS